MLKIGNRVRSKVFTAKLRGEVVALVTTPTTHSFYGASFARVRHDHGLVMWTPTQFLSAPPKSSYEAFHADPRKGWATLTRANQLLTFLSEVSTPYSHVANQHRMAGLLEGLSPAEAIEIMHRVIAFAETTHENLNIPAPLQMYDRGDYKGFTEISARQLYLHFASGFTHFIKHNLQGQVLKEALSAEAFERLQALETKESWYFRFFADPIVPTPSYGGAPSFKYAEECGLDTTWPLCGGTGY